MNVRYFKELIRISPRIFIMIGVLLVVNIGLYLYAAVYQQQRIESLQNSWFAKRKTLSGGGAQDSSAAYLQGESDLKVWRSRILPKKNFAGFLGTIYETAANNSLTFNGITYKLTIHKPEDLIAYTLDFTVTGKYAGVKSFIADLSRMREMFTIDAVSLSTGNVSNDAVGLKVQLTVFLKPEGP